jgi:hypothetical protein
METRNRMPYVALVAIFAAVLAHPRVGLAVCEERGIGTFPVHVQPAKGRTQCASVVNSDGTRSALFFDLKKGSSIELKKAGGACQDGSKHSAPCADDDECPGGDCVSPVVTSCSADAKGKSVAFVWSDFQGENLYHRNSKGTITQVTNLPCWCSDDVSKACTTSADCTDGSCSCPDVSGVQLSEKGDLGTFVTDGDAGGNASHADSLYAFDVKGKKGTPVVRGPLGQSARVCDESTANAGSPCTKDEDCGAVCGNGLLDPGETCDPDAPQSGCSLGQRCVASGANRCKCEAISCGNGIAEGEEECDGTDADCPPGFRCVAPGGPGACQCVPIVKLGCGNGVKDPGEQCDNSPCPPLRSCAAKDAPNECTCQSSTAVCNNNVLESGEECDGAQYPCPLGVQCDPTFCFCQGACGNNVVDPGEECDGTSIGACPAGSMCMSCNCAD